MKESKKPWEMKRGHWEAARLAALEAGNKALKCLGGSPMQKEFQWATTERIRLEHGAKGVPLRKGGFPIVSHRAVVEKALTEGESVPFEVLSEYPDLMP